MVRLRRRTSVGPVARYLGAVALVGVGVDHLWQFSVDSYSVIPTIGTLFALNFASALLVALGSFAGLEVSENTGLFGFMESGYRAATVLSIALDAATVIFVGAFLVANRGDRPEQ